MARGTIRIPDFSEVPEIQVDTTPPADVVLPPPPVIDAGFAKFMEMVHLHWPSQTGGFKLTSFDIRNDRQLRMTLGLVYMAMAAEQQRLMRDADERARPTSS